MTLSASLPRNPFHARPIIPLLLAFMVGIVWGNAYPGYARSALLLVVVAFFGIGFLLYRHKNATLLPLILFTGLGYIAIHPYCVPDWPADHFMHSLVNSKRRIIGVIDNQPVVKHHRLNLILMLEQLIDKSGSRPTTGKIKVSVHGFPPNLHRGDRISFRGKIKPLRNFNNPGGFDYRRFMGFQGIYGSSYTDGRKIKIIRKDVTHHLRRGLDLYRCRFAAFIDHNTTSPANGVLKALLIGDRTAISPQMADIFYRTGVGHLLAISGLHIGIIASTVFGLLVWVASRFTFLLLQARTKAIAAWGAVFPVFFYGLISGFSPSSQRAVIMVSVFLLSYIINRDQEPLNTLAVAALVILAISPPALFAVSFQLSFSAVLTILLGVVAFTRNTVERRRGYRRIVANLLLFLKVTLFATIGTLPLTLFYFNQLSLIGLIANLPAVPLIGFGVVPLGLLSLILMPWQAALAGGCLKLAAIILSLTITLLSHLSRFPLAAVHTVTPSVLEIIYYYLFLWGFLIVYKSSGLRAKHRLWMWGMGVILVIGFLDTGYWIYQRYYRADLHVTVLDVGQGSSTIVELPKGGIMVIDGGGFSDNSSFDMGARVVAPFLWRKKISTIDILALSHPNSDHLNGLLYLAEQFNVKEIWTNGQPADTLGYRRFIDIIHRRKLNAPPYPELSKTRNQNQARIDILYPPDNFLQSIGGHAGDNDNSMVIKIQLGAISFLVPGDIMHQGERELVRLNPQKLKSTVLIAPHHGSRTSSSSIFLDHVQPQTVIISAGYKNRFHLPHRKVLKKYKRRGYRIYRTDFNGAIRIITDGRQYQIHPLIGFQTPP